METVLKELHDAIQVLNTTQKRDNKALIVQLASIDEGIKLLVKIHQVGNLVSKVGLILGLIGAAIAIFSVLL